MRSLRDSVSSCWRVLAGRVKSSLAYVRRNPEYSACVFVICVMTLAVFSLFALSCILILLVQKMAPWVK